MLPVHFSLRHHVMVVHVLTTERRRMVEKVKIRTNIYLDPDHKRELERLALRSNVSVADLIRQAIDAYLAKRRKNGE